MKESPISAVKNPLVLGAPKSQEKTILKKNLRGFCSPEIFKRKIAFSSDSDAPRTSGFFTADMGLFFITFRFKNSTYVLKMLKKRNFVFLIN